jgi:hypothetical protein
MCASGHYKRVHEHLDDNIWSRVFRHFGPEDLGRAAAISGRLWRAATDSRLWYQHHRLWSPEFFVRTIALPLHMILVALVE